MSATLNSFNLDCQSRSKLDHQLLIADRKVNVECQTSLHAPVSSMAVPQCFDYIADRLAEPFTILFLTTRVAPPSVFLVNFSKEFTLNPYQGRRTFVYMTFPPSFQDIPKDSTFSTLRLSKTESVVNVLMTEVTSLYLPCGRTTLLSVFHIRLFA